jgi:hypothetical protein
MAKRDQPAGRIAVRWLPIEALTPDPKNARVHSARQVARIADSIAAFGFNVPILVDGRGGVLAGHGRLIAARRLGLKEVPTLTLDHLDEAERRAFMIADNRLGELASWDKGRLGVELKALTSLDLDFRLSATGFALKEIDLRIEAGRTPAGTVDAAGSPSKDGRPSGRPMDRVGRPPGRSPGGARLQGSPAARAGDVWTLGPHRLGCGDSAGLSAIDDAIRRWQAVTGDGARLQSTGEPFDEVARARRGANSEHARSAAE